MIEYLLKTSAVVAIFYLIYKLLLAHDTFFVGNRWFLFLGLISSFIIPYLVIPVYVETTQLDLTGYVFTNEVSTETIKKPFSILDFLPLIYFLGVTFFAVRFTVQFLSLLLIILRNKGKKIGRYIFIKTTNNVSPFSFFNWIVYNPAQFSEEEVQQIITHEQVHVKQRHSIDILLSHLSCIILWFNPFIWLYNKDLKQNLEFIADYVAANKTECKKSYQYTLLKTSVPSHQTALSNNFYNSLIKKRIVMLHKSKSKKINQLKYVFVIPILAVFLMSFNTKEVYHEKISEKTIYGTVENKLGTQKAINSDTLKIIFNKDLSDKDLEKIKSFLKKNDIIFTYSELKRNAKGEIVSIATKYETAEGNCTSNVTGEPIKPFYYFRLGTTSGVGPVENEKHKNSIEEKNIKKNHDTISFNNSENENQFKPWEITIGRNAVSDSTSWTPSNSNSKPSKKRVGLNWTSDEDEKVIVNGQTKSKVKIMSRNNMTPLMMVDGKEISAYDVNNIDTNSIDKIEVLKDKNSTQKYGDKGKNGVVLITTKKWETHFIIEKPFDSIPNKEDSSKYTVKLSGEALYKVDGKEVKKEVVDKLNPDDIESVNVYKGNRAIEKYGKKAKDGVIEITTKKKK